MKEFDLLKVLAQNPDRIFSKEELFEHVWSQVDQDGLTYDNRTYKIFTVKIKRSGQNTKIYSNRLG